MGELSTLGQELGAKVEGGVAIGQSAIVAAGCKLHVGSSFLATSTSRELRLAGNDLERMHGPGTPCQRRSELTQPGSDLEDTALRAKRQKIRHIGADAPKRALPFGRRSRWKRTLSGKK